MIISTHIVPRRQIVQKTLYQHFGMSYESKRDQIETAMKMAQNGHKLRFYGLLGVLNKLLAFSYTGETGYDKTLFLKYCQARQPKQPGKATKTLEIC